MLKDQFLHGEAATIAAAQSLAAHLRSGDLVALAGDLGAGKSTFARALIRALPLSDGSVNGAEEVPSPTYTLCQTYERAVGQVAHFDLYRLSDPDEALELGFDEALSDGVVLVEWPERLGPLLPANRLHLTLTSHGEGCEGGEGRHLSVHDQRT